MWAREDFAAAFVDHGMWVAAQVVVAASGLSYNIHAGFREADELLLQGNSQHTSYRFKFETNSLPLLAVDDHVLINGNAYTVKDMPALVGTGWFSTCNLKRTSRSYPKQAIQFPSGLVLPPPAPSPAPSSGAAVGILSGWFVTVDGAQSILVASGVAAVPFVTINGLIQPQGSYSFVSPVITYPSTLNIMAGDTIGAYLVS